MVKEYNNKFTKSNQDVFLKEAIVSAIIDASILCLAWVLYYYFIYNYTQNRFIIICFTLFYLLISYFLHYRIIILELVDIYSKDIVIETVTITNFEIENSWSGYLGHSNVSKFYSKDEMVDRFKLFFLNNNNEERFVRLIMSIEKRKLIYNLFLNNNEQTIIEIHYLKRSKILLLFNVAQSLKYDAKIEKNINNLNQVV